MMFENPIVLSAHEIWILIHEIGAKFIVGINNPFNGWLKKEKELAFQQSYQSLGDKDYIRVAEGGRFSINNSVYICVNTLANSKNVIVISNTSDSGFQQVYYYFLKDLYVEMKPINQGYQLKLSDELPSLFKKATNLFPQNVDGAGDDIIFPSNILRELVVDNNIPLSKKIRQLTDQNLLDNIQNILSFDFLYHPYTRDVTVSSITTLFNDEAIWLLVNDLSSTDSVKFERTTNSKLLTKIERLFSFAFQVKNEEKDRQQVVEILFDDGTKHTYELRSDIILRDLVTAIRIQENFPEQDKNGRDINYGFFVENNVLNENKTLEELQIKNISFVKFMVIL